MGEGGGRFWGLFFFDWFHLVLWEIQEYISKLVKITPSLKERCFGSIDQEPKDHKD